MDKLVRISDAASLGLHAMGYMARHGVGHVMSVAEIAGALDVSGAHLSKVLQRLSRAGLVASRRGPKGGFSLGVDADDVTLLDIYEAVDGPLPTSTCLLDHDECPSGPCVMGSVLHEVYEKVHQHLANTRLSALNETPSFKRFG